MKIACLFLSVVVQLFICRANGDSEVSSKPEDIQWLAPRLIPNPIEDFYSTIAIRGFTFQIINILKSSPGEIKALEYDRNLLVGFFCYWHLSESNLVKNNRAIECLLKNAFAGGALSMSMLPEAIERDQFFNMFAGAMVSHTASDIQIEETYKAFRLFVVKVIEDQDLPLDSSLTREYYDRFDRAHEAAPENRASD